jgi:peptide/nickel transport system substrate-binding protein
MMGNPWRQETMLGRRYTRRAVLRAAAVAGAAGAGWLAMACATQGDRRPMGGAAPGGGVVSTAVAGGQTGIAALIGRTGTEPKGETPVRGGVFVQAINGNPPTFDPHATVNVYTMFTASATMGRLYRFKTFWAVAAANSKEIEPDLALSYETPDGVTWIYKLRPNVRFHDIPPVNGRVFEAIDVKATFARAVAPTSANRGFLLMIDPEKIETPDKQTVVFKLNYPYAPFSRLMASSLFAWIMPREGAEGVYDPARQVIGTGPFIFESYQPDVALTFKRNPNWFESGRPYIDGVKLPVIPDQAQRYAQFTAGNLHVVGVLQEDLETLQRQNPKAERIQNVGNGNGIMYYPLGDPASPFRDIRVRQAISLAVDRAAYGKIYYGDKYIRTFNVTPDFGKWVITWEELSPETQQWYNYDLPRAKRLMEEAGGARISVKMIYPVGNPAEPLLRNQSETVYNMLTALPWKVTYVPVDYTRDWVGGGKGYQYTGLPPDTMAWWGLAVRTTVDEHLSGWWYSKSTTNMSRLNDPRLDAMIDKARTLLNEEEQLKAYKEVQKYILDNVYCLCGMVNGLGYTLVQPRVRNFTLGDGFGPGPNVWGKLWLAS